MWQQCLKNHVSIGSLLTLKYLVYIHFLIDYGYTHTLHWTKNKQQMFSIIFSSTVFMDELKNDRSFKRWCSCVISALRGWSQCLYLGEGWLPQAQKIFDDLTPLAQNLTSCLSKQGETSKMESGSSLLRHYGFRVEN